VIVFSVHEHGYQKQCQDDPVGTYIAEVPYFMNGYLQEVEQETEEQGYEYQEPAAAQYLQCTAFVIENQQFYLQIGCADDTSLALAVNIYEDNACTVRSTVDGYDDSNIDVSSIQVRTDLLFRYNQAVEQQCLRSGLLTFRSKRKTSTLRDIRCPSKSARPV